MRHDNAHDLFVAEDPDDRNQCHIVIGGECFALTREALHLVADTIKRFASGEIEP